MTAPIQAQIIAALEFYADENNWKDISEPYTDIEGGGHQDYYSEAKADGGDIARAVLRAMKDI